MRSTLDFLLYTWLQTEQLTQRPRFVEHNRETFDAVLETCERLAADKFAPFNRLVDTEEPRTEMGADGALRVVLPAATHEARAAYAQSGMLAAAQDYALGGMQLPYVVEAAANSFFAKASISIGSNLLTVGNANCLLIAGTPAQQAVFAANQLNGRWAGTMCLSEPQAGSSLSDIATRAELDDAADTLGPRYRLRGNKMWISSGEHEMTENIVHLVLAKIPDAAGKLPAGTRGISLFIVPKRMVNVEGALTGERNDVVLAGLNHKCGWRGTTNTLLNFGEGQFKPLGQAGAVGYLVGQPGEGLKHMFHMMNEARIGIGMAATMLGMAGYHASLDYAKTRTQGRPLSGAGKDVNAPPVRLIEHADIRRMLLAQKSICEGALALQLYCARLVDDLHTADPSAAADAGLLLELLTPIAKSWPSENCLEANSLAIQIHGGYGYTRDFPVEQYWRDQRLNMIHEGTHGIQAMDLLGRKVLLQGGKALALLGECVARTVANTVTEGSKAKGKTADSSHLLSEFSASLQNAWTLLVQSTQAAWRGKGATLGAAPDANAVLANAVPYMQAFGHVVLAWIWLDVVTAETDPASPAAQGRLAACQYHFRSELPKIQGWLALAASQDRTSLDCAENAF